MRLTIYLFAISICLSVSFSSNPVQARFFPNISSIPSWLIPNETIVSGAWDAFNKFNGCHRGKKTDGLSNLKHYFNNFGYLSIADHSNFTDDFDDALESAVKTYQKNFNLNVTGELDQQTLNYIVKPRCGNPDIVNGTTNMNSGKPASSNATRQHFHTVQHYTFFPGQPVWSENKRELTYGFQPENELSDNVKSVFSRAFEKWATVTPLTFKETASFYTADIKIGFYVGDHGDGEAFDGVLGTLAHAFSPPSGWFHLDGDENWVISGDITTSSVTSSVDLESVAVHEIGHLLGLGHSSVEDSIMYPTISSRTKKVELASDDIQGIQHLYGVNPDYNNNPSSSSTPSTQARETSDGGVNSLAFRWLPGGLLALGICLL